MNPMAATDSQVDQIIGSAYQVIKYVAANMESLVILAESLDPVVDAMNMSLEALRRTYAETGHDLVTTATFATGAMLTTGSQVLLDKESGAAYSWSGSLPKIVPQDSTPGSSGGIGIGAWVPQHLTYLRTLLASPIGVSMVGGAASTVALNTVGADASLALIQVREVITRSYAEAGHQVVPGSFQSGFTIVNANDVVLDETTGKGFSGPAGTYPGNTDPSSVIFVDRSMAMLPVTLSRLGCTTTGDNTAVMNAIFADLKGSGAQVLVDKDFPISGQVKIDGLFLSGTGRITGSGSLVGVVGNHELPYENIQVWNNLVTASERNSAINLAVTDVIVDPLFGDDTSPHVVKSLQRALDVIAALVISSPTRDYTIMMRSGRNEIPNNLSINQVLDGWGGPVDEVLSTSQVKFSDLLINADSTARYGVHIAPYPGEAPVVCPPTKWFFPGESSEKYKGRPVVNNHTGAVFFKLFGADGVERQCAGSWNRDTHAVQRNQNRNVTIAGVNQNITHSIRLPRSLHETLAAASAAELAAIRVRVTQWFTTSWHVENMELTGDMLSFRGYTADQNYANGWAVINADQFGAPFFIENLKAFINRDDEFASTATEVVLPRDDVAFFTTTPLTYAALLDFYGTKNVTVKDGISVRYVTGDPVQVARGTWEVKKNPLAAIRLGNYGSSYSTDFYGLEGDAIKLSKIGALVKKTTARRIGGNTVTHVDGAHYSIVRGCSIDEHAMDQAGAFGIAVTGKEIEVSECTITNGGFSAIRCDSSAFVTDQSFGAVMSGGIFNNICLGIGMRNGRLSERYPTGDTGVMTINGRGPKTSYFVYSNVLGNCIGAGGSRALFLDDGVNGTRIHHNIIFGAQDYSVDARPVNNNTYDNHVYNNLLVGKARVYSLSAGSGFSENVVFGGTDIGPGVTNSGNTTTASNPEMTCQQGDDVIKTNAVNSVVDPVLTEFTKSFVRKLSYI